MRRPSTGRADSAAQGERARGALLGLAIGDALGATNDGKRIPTPAFPQLCDGIIREPQGGGPNRLRPGQVSDETQLACCVGLSLRELRAYDPDDVCRKYLSWRGLKLPAPSITMTVLDQIQQQRSWHDVAKNHWLRNGKKPCDNGSLVRAAPIGVFFAGDDKARAKASLEDSALTHYHPLCQLACAALNGAIAKAITSPKQPTAADLVQGALTALSIAGASLGQAFQENVRDVLDAAALLKADLELAKAADPQLYGPEFHLNAHPDHVRVTFRYAFWLAFHAPSLEAALIDTANRGGDSDGNGAVAGALLGALHGVQQIPEAWRRIVLDALNGSGGPLWDTYHPRHLMPLVDS